MSELSHDAAEDGFHEIQLSGKQLVFLFIVTTTVIVVVFLCGVKVGRGVRAVQGDEPDQVSAAAAAPSQPQPQPQPVAEAGPPAAEPPAPAAETPEELSYHKRLQGDKAPSESLKAPASAPASAPKNDSGATARQASAPKNDGGATARQASAPKNDASAAATQASAPKNDASAAARQASAPKNDASAAARQASPPKNDASATARQASPPKSDAGATAEQAGDARVPSSGRAGTWVVQVIATRDREVASSVVKKLAGKGYPAFLVSPAAGTAQPFYKVHVGRYNDRGEAEQVSTRIKKEEQFQSWITR